MNFLAHIFLSGTNEKLMVGNFIADFVKGSQFNLFEPEIKRGIILHRAIDEYTDLHPIVSQSKDKLREKYRHYAGVIVDVYYDHFLAKNWKNYHHIHLNEYTQSFYDMIYGYEEILPEGTKYMLPFMQENNWLLNYAQKQGIKRALTGMSRRTKFDSKMDEAIVDLEAHYPAFELEFTLFFEELRAYVARWVAEN